MTRLILIFLFVFTASQIGIGGNPPSERQNEILSIININESNWQSFVYDAQLYEQRLDTFSKVRFWSLIMNTSDEFMIINHARSRKILEIISYSDWNKLSAEEKDMYRMVIKEEHCLDTSEKIFITRGKAEYYQFRKAMPSIDKGIEIFMEEGVDPWYAQTILLIESPGQLIKSPDGALGSFQLMTDVARKFGLRVDKVVDERKNFDRSAFAASQLIKTICLPYAREMLAERGLEFNESDLWFRLLVMHIYHAGAYNVKSALAAIDGEYYEMDLIKKLWETESKGFKNASQNYTQIALASLLQLDDLIHESCVIYHSSEIPLTIQKLFPAGSVYALVTQEGE